MDWTWVRGNGIVSGELTAQSPIVQARLERLYVKLPRPCDAWSAAGRISERRHGVQLADQQVQQLEFQLEQARAEIDIADREAQAAAKLTDARRKALLQQQIAVLCRPGRRSFARKRSLRNWSGSKPKLPSTVQTPSGERRSLSNQTKRADEKDGGGECRRVAEADR